LYRFILPTIIALVAVYLYTAFDSPSSTLVPKYSIKMSLSSKLSITDVNLKGEKVLIRVDFNVPYVCLPGEREDN
jgi:phosphoglycerate kinase